MKINSPVLGEVVIRCDIYRIIHTSLSGNVFAYTFCSDCLYKWQLTQRSKAIRQTIWARDNLKCQHCGAMTQPTFERLSTDLYKKQNRRKQSNGKKNDRRNSPGK